MKNINQTRWFLIAQSCITFVCFISFFCFPQVYVVSIGDKIHPRFFFYIILPILLSSTFLTVHAELYLRGFRRNSLAVVGFSVVCTLCLVIIGVARLFLTSILPLAGHGGIWRLIPFAIFGFVIPLLLCCVIVFMILGFFRRKKHSERKAES